MKVLVIGSGGREHALAFKLAQSPKVVQVFVAPGNAGTATEPKVSNINLTEQQELIEFCQQEQISLTVVGPEVPLAEGIVDAFKAAKLSIFGPTQAAAQLESSKDFAKRFMRKYGIPTADYQTFSEIEKAKAYVADRGVPIVIKADGLAAGKGVLVAMTLEEANRAIEQILSSQMDAKIVIEDFLTGVEASFIVMVDGKHILPLATSKDHKRLLDQDQGPNTGGMGAYSPAPVVTESVYQKVMKKIIQPTVEGMVQEGHPFVGFLYAGLMIDEAGEPFTIEFNCRCGDPETQAIMVRLETDLVTLIEAACEQRLDSVTANWNSQSAVGVVLATQDYPQGSNKGERIDGLEKANQIAKVFHAATTLQDGQMMTNGGRVLCVVGLADELTEAKQKAYRALSEIQFKGMQYRKDIADNV